MASPGTVERPDLATDHVATGGWKVIVFDNDYNTVEEVMTILIIATNCTPEEASIETWEVHHLGKSVVHYAGESECQQVAEVIATIGIHVEVLKED